MFKKAKEKTIDFLDKHLLDKESWDSLQEKEGPTDPTEVTQKPKEFKMKLKKEKQKRKMKEMLSHFIGRKSGGGKSW